MNDLQLGPGGQRERESGVHLFNRSWFILLVFGAPLFLLQVWTVWVCFFGGALGALLCVAFACFLGDFLLGRLTAAIALQVDQYKAAAEASTSEVCEKLGLIGQAYRNFLRFMRINPAEIRESVRLRNPRASSREIERLVQDAIEEKLKDRYAIVLPFWIFRYNCGPAANFKLAATRFYRAMESLKRLEPTIQRRDDVEEIIAKGRATTKLLEEKNTLDSIISQSLLRVNGEIKEIPPLAPQILTWRFGKVVILSYMPFFILAGICCAMLFGYL